jgi:hypothetical protein
MLQVFRQIIDGTHPVAWTTGSIGYYDAEGVMYWTSLKEYILSFHDDGIEESVWVNSSFPFDYAHKLDGKMGVIDGRPVYGLTDGMFLYLEPLRNDFSNDISMTFEGLSL